MGRAAILIGEVDTTAEAPAAPLIAVAYAPPTS